MNHFTLARRAAWTALATAGLLALLAGCSKRITSADAGYTTLEGRPDANARLLAWPDTPSLVEVWADLGTPGPDPPDEYSDTLLALVPSYRTGPGVINTLLLDRTAASGYQLYRYGNNGGLQALTDFTIRPYVKWLSSGWECYSYTDLHPSSYSPATYVGRGLLDGRVTTSSPLTNPAIGAVAAPVASIVWDPVAAPVAPGDSLFKMAWSQVDGAAGYWIQVYQFTNAATIGERRASGTPNPVLGGNVKNFLVAFVAGAGSTTYKLGAPGAEVLTAATPINGQTYYARVTAVDSRGNVIAWMRGERQLLQLSGTYEYLPLGAALISPHR